MKKIILLATIALNTLASFAQCNFTTTINNSGATTGCGPRLLTAAETGNVWTQKNNFGGYGGLGGYSNIAFSIGTKGYMGLGYNYSTFAVGNDFWEYDPATDSWTQKANFGGAGRQKATAFSIGAKGYVGCGEESSTVTYDDFWEYDPSTNVWTQKASPGFGPRYYAMGFGTATKGYLGCGYHNTTGMLSDLWEYDPGTNTWAQKTNFGGGGRIAGIGFSIGSKGYFAGGLDAGNTANNDIWEYDPGSNTWTQKANMPGPGRWLGVGFAIGGKGYVGTGVNGGYTAIYNDFYEFDPVSNTWATLTQLPTLQGRYQACGFAVGTYGYLINGSSNFGAHNSVYRYCPSLTYSWSSGASTQTLTANASGTYSVLVTNAAGCTASASTVLNLSTQPTISISGGSVLCAGNNVTLTASGAGTYTWSSNAGGGNGSSVVLSPTAMTSYSVAGTTGTCVGTSSLVVTPFSAFTGSITVAGSSLACGTATIAASTAGDTWTAKTNFGGTARYHAGGFSIGDKGYIGTGFDGSALNNFYEYNFSTNAWTQKSGVGSSGRYNAVMFSVGSKGYVGMGTDGTNGLSDFWEYDPTTDAWTQKANFNGVPVQGAAVMVVGSNAYIVGGSEVATSSLTSQNWQFNPQANIWTQKAGFPGGSRRNLTAFGIGSTGYAGMGYNSIYFFDFYAYNPSTDTWTGKATFTGLGRELATSFVLGGKAYVGTGTGANTYSDMYQYDPSTDTWTTLSSFGGGARYAAVGFAIGSKGYIGTGYNGSSGTNDFYEYTPPGTFLWSNAATTQTINPTANGLYTVAISNYGGCSSPASQSISIATAPTLAVSGPTFNCGSAVSLSVSGASTYTWSSNAGSSNATNVSVTPTVATNYTVTGTMGTCTANTTYYVNGSLLTASITPGGSTVSCGNQTLTAVATASTWFAKTNFAGTARSGASAFVIGSKGYICLGITSSNTYLNDLWEYDYTSDTWTQKATFPSYSRYYASAFSIGTKGYITCGASGSNYYNDLWEYNQSTNAWIQRSSFPGTARYSAAAFAFGGNAYVGCGYNAGTYYNDFYQYDPATYTWTAKASFGGSARYGAVGFTVGTKGYIGLGQSSVGYLGDMYEYDATANSWTAKTSLPGSARRFAVAMTISNSAYVGLGTGASSAVYNDFWRFDPSGNTWLQLANYSAGTRHSAVALSLGGKGYVYTGQNLSFNTKTQESYEFQPTPSYLWSTGSTLTVINPSVSGLYTFTTTNFLGCTASASQSVAISPNPTTSVSATSTLLCSTGSSATLTASGASNYTWSSNAGGGNGTSVVVTPTIATQYTLTGATGSCIITSTLLIDAYPTATVAVVPLTSTVMCGAVTLSASATGNTLTAKATFGGTARYGAVAFSIGSKGYFGTGFDGANKNDFWEYDISTNVWTQKANFGGVARRHAVGFAIGTKGYIGTGYTTGAVADFWEYNPATNTWASKTSYPINVWGAVGFGIGSKGYIQGGSNTSGSTINNNLREYDPTTNTWLSRNNAPATSYLASAFVVNSTVYVCGGQNTSGYLNTVYAWNQTAGSWTTKTSFPGTARRSASGFAIGTKGFVAGGYDGNAKNEIYEYNTISNTWTQRASLATARYYSAAFSAYNHGYVIGGYSGSANLADMWQYDALPTYSWSSGATTETVSLSTTGNYTVTGTYAGSCSNFSTQSIGVSPFPTIAISGPTAGICGASITLSGSGASTYTWSSNAGSLNTSSVSVSPTVNTTYTLSGTTGTCSSSSSLAVIGKKVVSSAIVSSIPTTTCGSITLSLSPLQGNTFTAKNSLPGTTRSGAVAFSIGSKGYVGTGNPITALNDFWEYDVAADTWTQKANYPVAVVYAVGFSIGSYGYLGTGLDDFNAYRSNFYQYNPATNTWSAMASVGGSGARAYATAFATSTKGYICGGYNGSSALNDLIEYDPGTNTWTSKTGITGARAEAVGFSMNNKGYVGCGSDLTNNLSDFWEYNPTTDTWAQKTNYPGAGWMLNYAVSVNNRGFVGGGIGAFSVKQSDFWEYSASTNSWTSVSPMPYTRNGGSAFAANNRAYFFGGENNVADFNDLYEFEPPAQGAWSTGSVSAVLTTSTTGTYSVLVTNADGCTASYSQTVALSPAVPLVVTSPSVICEGQTATLTASGANTYTWGATAGNGTSSLVTVSPTVATNYSVIAQTGSCVAISSLAITVNTLPIISISAPGGTAVCGSGSLALNASSTYTWVQRASCGNASGRMYAVAFSIGTKGYMGTGYGTSGFNNDFWEYDPATNTWTQKANFAGGARQQAVGFSIGTKGYVGTGYDGINSYNDFWEFDPSANTWTQKSNFGGGARYAAVGFGIGTKGYIGTGIGAGFLNDFWEYDPGTNSWTQKTNLAGLGRYGACAFSIGNKGYISAGFLSNYALGNDIWEYDQGGNSWTQKASYTLAGRLDAAAASANNRGYIIGGDDGSNYLSQVLEYNPVSNTWAQILGLAAGTSGPSAFGIGSKLFAAAGYAGVYGGYNDYLFEYTGSNYPFVWSNTSTLSAISVTNSGSYSVTTTNSVTGCSNTAVQSVSVVPSISISVSGPSVICSGSANLTANGASNYTWSANAGSSTLSTVAVSPSTTTTYSVVGSLGTCTSSAVYSVAIAAPFTVSAVASPTSVCNGGTVVLNGTGASTYTWSGGVSNNVAFTPTASGSYSVTGTNSAGCTATAQVSVGIATSPTITVANATICSGSPYTISPSGASTYTYSGGSSVVSPTVTTTYSVAGTSAQGCAATNTAVTTVSVSACSAASALSFDGTNDHVVTPNLSSSIPANSNITIETWFKPNAAGVVVGELGNGSLSSLWYLSMIEVVGSGSVMVRVYNLPAVFVGTVSYGTWNHVALRYSHSGARVDGFLNGVASASFVTGTRTSPLSASYNQFYQLGGSSLNNLGSGAYFNGSIDELRIWNTVRSQCDIQTYLNAEIPASSAGLVANYHFNQGFASQSNSTVTSLFDASGNNNNAALTNFALNGSVSNWVTPGGVLSGFTTTPAPPTLTVNSGAICPGASFTIVPSGASTYTYSSGSAIVSPTTTTSYSVTGTATNGCLSNTAVVNVTVNAIPNLTVNNGAVCLGESFTINPLGAISYTYPGGSPVVTPTATSNYTVMGGNGVCTSSAVISVVVNPLPTVAITSNTTGICSGTSATFNASASSNLVAYYRFNEGSGTTVADQSGNNLNATFVNSPTWGASTATFTGAGNAVNLGPGYLTVADNAVFNNLANQITIEAWIYQTDNTNNTIVDRANYNFLFSIGPNGQSGLGFFNNNTWNYSSGTVPVNQWVHVAVTFNSATSEVKFYMNGTLLSTHTRSGALFSNAGPLNIGRQEPNSCQCNIFNGRVDELRIWRGVRTAAQLLASASSTISTFSYNWSPAAGLNVTNSASVIASPSTATLYSVTLTDANGCTVNAQTSLSVNSSPTLSANSATICNGSTTTLTVSGANTYTWASSSGTTSGANFVVTPTISTTYSVIGTNSLGCNGTQTVSVSLGNGPTVTVNAATVCAGSPATLIASGADTYTWSNSSNSNSIVVSPTATSVYTVNGNFTGCPLSGSITTTVSVNSLPSVSVASGSICIGSSFTLNPSGALTYTFSSGSPVVTPSSTASYSVFGTNAAGCVNALAAVANVTVNTVPSITVNGGTICAGQPFVINPSGASTYTYSSGSNTVTPATTSIYSVSGTSGAGCISAVSTTLSVSVSPLPTITVNDGTICSGGSVTLSPSGANTYVFSGGSNVVSPLTNTVYTISGTSTEGCASAVSASANITVNASPTISVNSGPICIGQSFTINPSGANSYTYSSGSAVVSPTSNTSYSITGTSSLGCVSASAAVSAVTVNTLPVVSASSATICSGATATLTASGANTYTWSNSTIASSIVVSPTGNTSYSVSGTSSAGCVGTITTATVTVGAGPAITVNSPTLCSGQSATLTAAGVTSFTWSTGVNTNSIVVSPSTNTVYTVSGNLAGCPVTATNTSSITVVTTPTISATNGTICMGQTYTIVPSGASTYTYSSGSNTVSPTATSNYSVIGTATNGCLSSSITLTVTVNNLPTVSVSSGSICAGQVYTINPSGASSYIYSGGSNTVSPASSTVYSVSGTNTTGCISASPATLQLIVYGLPTVTATGGTVCAGSPFTITANGANTYVYSGGAVVTPSTTTIYSVSGTSTEGCVSATPALVTVTADPIPTVAISSGSICGGQSYTLVASGANTYTYLNGGPVITPALTSTYGVIGSSSMGCISSNTAIANVLVDPLPTLTAISATICAGATATLLVSGANSYTWSNSVNANSITVTPTGNVNYTVLGSSAAGCLGSAAIASVVVGPGPAITVNSSTICSGTSATLVANGVTSFTWSSGANTSSIVVSPITNTSYTVSGNLSGCAVSASNTVSVSVLSTPTIVVNSGSICAGDVFTINPAGANTYTVSGGSTTVSPTANTSYTITGTDTNGCLSNSVVSTITVNAIPVITINSGSVCAGSVFTLIPAGASSYSVSGGSLTVSPSVTSSYSVSGTSIDGCVSASAAIATVVVNALPVVLANVTRSVICAGDSTTFYGLGADTYTWSGGAVNGQTFVPAASGVYSVNGTNSLTGCASTNLATSSITVNTVPLLVVNSSNSIICAGESATLNAIGALTFTWDGGSNTNSIVVSPTLSTNYTVMATDANNCTATSVLTQSVSDCLGISRETQPENAVKLFPNPTNGKLTAMFGMEGYKGISVYNELGELVLMLNTDAREKQFDLSEFAKGVYFVRVQTSDTSINFRVVLD